MSKHFCLRCGYAFDEPHLAVECPECESVTYLSREDITPELIAWIDPPELAALRARVAELEAAQAWHPASEVPPEISIDDVHTVPVAVCHGPMLAYAIDCFNTQEKSWCKYGDIHCWKWLGEIPDSIIFDVAIQKDGDMI